MKALFYTGKNALEFCETSVPTIGEEEALIRVRYAGICGTDLSIYAGKHPRAKEPLIMGHEFSGTVEGIYSKNSDVSIGDKVVAEPLISCGECFACRSGFGYVCQNLGLYGIDAPGSFAEYIKVPVEKLFKVPESISLHDAALIEPLAVAVHSVRLSDIKVSDTVCVLGAGPIGLLTAIVASQSGARQVIICEKEQARIRIAEGFGLQVIDINEKDPEEIVYNMTDNRGADVVFEAAGAPATVLLATRLARVRGEIMQVATPKETRDINIVDISFKELIIKGVRVYAPYDFERAISFMQYSGLDFSPLLSQPYSLEQGAEAFGKAKEGSDVMRVIFKVE
jgi:2-desacetyl-2-hydroxyethyl bacteriochlorophyllide A dehydrogenase